MSNVRRKSAARQRVIQTTRRAAPISIAAVSYSLAKFSGAESIPTWASLVAFAACALFAVVDKITDFFLRLVIIRGYREDYWRRDADDYVTMFRELN